MSIDKQKTLKLLEELVAIDSVNPTLVPATALPSSGQAGRPGASGEQRAAEHVRDFLRASGIAAELEEAAAGRPNVVATIGPASVKPALMIVAHIDTVGAGDMREPFTPRVRDGKMYGRGALDIKSGVAAMCAAAVEIVREGARLARPVIIAGVVDEECNSIGTEALLRRGHTAEAAIVLEPTDLKLVIAHKGYAWFEIVTHGRAAHGSLPVEGRDAIRMMGRVLVALDELETRLASRAPHPRLGNASLHASLIEGGQELSSYPAECRLQLERRMLPGETEQSAEAELREMLTGLEKQNAEFRATLRGELGARPAYEIREDAPLVQRAKKIIAHVCGACELAGMSAWTDTALLAAAGIPGVVFGPTGHGLHGAEEYVELDSVTQCAAALHEMILEFCAQ
ncbi:MAG TPA: ArgE/DapE family deacylase [Candidatus Acidoferrales bacterium]|nr:ArgE/DapE family deacylase [Candidatus Acidoferrales bacterium]